MVHTDYMALVVMIAIPVVIIKIIRAKKNSFRNQRSRGR